MQKENAKFEDMLPSVWKHLETLKINEISAPQDNSFHVAIAQSKDNKIEVTSKHIGASLCQTLQSQAESLGWGGKKPVVIQHGKQNWLLVSPTKLDVSPLRKARDLGLQIAALLKSFSPKSVIFCNSEDIPTTGLVEGWIQGLYQYEPFKKQTSSLTHTDCLCVWEDIKTTEKTWNETLAFARASILTRVMGDAPPNWFHSEKFAEAAEFIAKNFGGKLKIQGREDIRKMGMGGFHSVAKGALPDPKLITFEIDGYDTSRTVCLVGKGLTFDSGGISLKPAGSMDEMKYDMCGGANVLGAAAALAQIKPPTNVVCIIGAVENMPGSSATRPGDVVTTMKGDTIEILNTDAEGRLVLVDLLHYGISQYNPEFVIDAATLTGAVLMALGSAGSAVISNHSAMANHVLQTSEHAGEPMWQLPMWPELNQELDSKIADVKNITSPATKAGTITAGVFLSRFVGDTPWAHIDIAGTAWSCRATGFPAQGGSAFGMRTMAECCLNHKEAFTK
ncbi:MAG: M17 family metallopeptidase [Oligoflexales bacterium]